MTAAELAPRERIIEATLGCFERFGVEETTVRRIAEAAQVNVAAINYYFGSKDRLVETALAVSLEQVFPNAAEELQAAIEAEQGDIRAGTARFFLGFFQVAFKWPRTAFAHLRPVFAEQRYDAPVIVAFHRFVEVFLRVVEPAMPHPDPASRRAVVHLIWSAFLMTCVAPAVLENLVPESELSERMAAPMLIALFGPAGSHGPIG